MTPEFSRRGFEALLSALASHDYRFLTFRDLLAAPPGGRYCLLRHDVDVSLDFAVQMARLEAARGVRATYFIMLRSPMYNAFGRRASTDIRQLAALGHEIGLHFDSAHADGAGRSIEEGLTIEMEMLSYLSGTAVSAFSFHQPTPAILAARVAVPGALNAYNLEQELGCRYLSDSNRDWRGNDPFDLIEQRHDGLQILLHPVWWMCEHPDLHDCWDAAILQHVAQQQDQLLATEGAYGPPRRLHLTRGGTRAPGQSPAGLSSGGIMGPDRRAYLAPLRDEDAAVLFSWINDRELLIASAAYRPTHHADHEAWFRDVRSRPDVAIFGIRRVADDELVGTCQLCAIDRIHRSAELRIRIGVRAAQGAGLGTDACHELLRHAFHDLNLHRVYLDVFDSNEPARRLYAKIGFIEEGRSRQAAFIDGAWRDVVAMAILRTEYAGA